VEETEVQVDEAALERLLDDLTKPMFVWRMNRAQADPRQYDGDEKHPKLRAARTARGQALRQVHEAVQRYAQGR
jgi:hypothetical protein